ncbi:hypothetical protein [Spirulina sp. 06S082]|uniref:hypothetical protein n=1 Tax=Spirulina sp. 06S082 TaxID=3110248 RepID=UPI002B21EAD4|nr:hypothetical protein [Spirulina sp. 06S082]MEA5469981.1 hypothetical protein [Spirulina sp. 06S082]
MGQFSSGCASPVPRGCSSKTGICARTGEAKQVAIPQNVAKKVRENAGKNTCFIAIAANIHYSLL